MYFAVSLFVCGGIALAMYLMSIGL
jgi:hypothetical protein